MDSSNAFANAAPFAPAAGTAAPCVAFVCTHNACRSQMA